MYNLNCTPTALGYKVEGKLHLGVREQNPLNVAGLQDHIGKLHYNVLKLVQPVLFQLHCSQQQYSVA
jgi:hypothetical protein